MTPERWKQIDELFDAVLEIPETQREDFLSKIDDLDLKNEVLSLLNAQKSSEKFMEHSAMNVMAKEIASQQNAPFENSFINKTLGNYQINRPIGAGGMGEVYLAQDTKLNRKVALKILPKEFLTDNERIKRFEREARAVSVLNHPNIVTVFDVGKLDNINFLATEYVEGKTVRDLIDTKLKIKDVLPIIIQCCEALSAAHEAGIIHRDIKPENIMVRPDGYVKILDFGLAKLSEEQPIQSDFAGTMKGVVIGTPAYMSPEQISDEKVDHRTDLWSIGVVLYEMLTGKNPFKAENRQAIFQAVLSKEPPLASTLNPEISTDLDQILVKALEKDADLSYQTASDLRADLKRVKREIDSSPSWTTRSVEYKQKSVEKKTLNRTFLYVGSFIFVILTIFGIWYFNSKQTKIAVEWKNAQNLQLTETPGIEGYPSLSPDGKYFVFAGESNGERKIFRQRVGGKLSIPLTADSKANDTMPVYSFDGKSIAFRSDRSPSGIYVMEETGENVRRVSDIGFHPSWSPDGNRIVVSDKAAALHTVHTVPNSRLWIIDLKTGEKKPLDTKGDAIMPNWSPNGNRIAFWYVADGQLPNIATISVETGEIVPIAIDSASDWNPVWSPDGKFIYFSSDRLGSMNLWRVAIDEVSGKQISEPESIGTTSKYTRHVSFSRDGKLMVYVRYESKSNLQTVPFDAKTLKITGEINWVTSGDRELGNPDLSPDSEFYVIRQPTRTQEDLVVFDKTGQNSRNLTNNKFRERLPDWSPDGKKIAFNTDLNKKYQIWTINKDGSDLKQLTFTEKDGAIAAVYSPDGSKMAFTEITGSLLTSSIMDLTKSWQDQKIEVLPPFPAYNGSLSVRDWSKDGSKLLLIFLEEDGDESGIAVYDLKTAKYKKMSETGSNPFWLNDNRHFIFNDRKGIYLCDFQNKKITELIKPSIYEIQQPKASPDNTFLYYRYLQVDADVWLLDASQK